MKMRLYMYLSVFIHITLIDRSKYIYIIYIICMYRDVYFNEKFILIQLYSRVSRFPKVYHCYNSGHDRKILNFFPSRLSAIMYSDRELRKLNQVQLDSFVRILFFT